MDVFPEIPNEAIAVVLPLVIEYLNAKIELLTKQPLTETDRAIVAFGICFVLAALFNLDTLMVGSIQQFWYSMATIFFISYGIFKLWWKNTKYRANLQSKFYGNPHEEEEREPEQFSH